MSLALLELIAPAGLPLVGPGDDLAAIIADALREEGIAPAAGDVLVVAQKLVSRAEGRLVDLRTVMPGDRATALAAETGKDPRLIEVILSESRRMLDTGPDRLIAEHRLGLVLADAGVEQSNADPEAGGDFAMRLPEDPDASARALQATLSAAFGVPLAVVISDAAGRAWRRGTVGIALGAAGLPALIDARGTADLYGRRLGATEIGLADNIASAAALVMGEAAEGRPLVVMRGLEWAAPDMPASALLPPGE